MNWPQDILALVLGGLIIGRMVRRRLCNQRDPDWDQYVDDKRVLSREELAFGFAFAIGFPAFMLIYFATTHHTRLWW